MFRGYPGAATAGAGASPGAAEDDPRSRGGADKTEIPWA